MPPLHTADPAQAMGRPDFAAPLEPASADGATGALTPADMATIAAMSCRVTFPAGAHLFRQGDPHEGIVFIVAGRVRSYYTSPQGREMTLAYWPGGHFVGAPQLLGGGEHMWSSVATEPTTGQIMTGAAVTKLVHTHPNLALVLIEGLVYKSKCYAALLQMVGTQSKAARLAQLLLTLTDSGDGSGTLPYLLTQQELANMIGATRQSVAHTLDRLEAESAISRTGNAITVLDAGRLRRMCA